jgi:hypothetical protein
MGKLSYFISDELQLPQVHRYSFDWHVYRYQESSEIQLPVRTVYLAFLMHSFNMTIFNLIVLLSYCFST